MAIITVKAFKCDRCGYIWLNKERTEKPPMACSHCKSFYWNRGKKAKKK